ncbi:MAG: hypothetical protein R3C26_11090 [Calditrichia bacterium]
MWLIFSRASASKNISVTAKNSKKQHSRCHQPEQTNHSQSVKMMQRCRQKKYDKMKRFSAISGFPAITFFQKSRKMKRRRCNQQKRNAKSKQFTDCWEIFIKKWISFSKKIVISDIFSLRLFNKKLSFFNSGDIFKHLHVWRSVMKFRTLVYLLMLCFCMGLTAQESVDLQTITRIKQEGFKNSK